MQYQRCISVIIYPWPWYMYVCMILNPDAWCMMHGMVHASMMRNFLVTEGPTEKVILGDAYIHDACMHDAYIYAPWSLCICQWCINVWCIHPWSLRLDYAACVCDAYIHDAAILSWKDGRTNQRWSWHACVWCMYSWCGIFVMHVQTSTLMHTYIMHVCIMHIHMLLDHVCTMHIHMLLDNDAYVQFECAWIICLNPASFLHLDYSPRIPYQDKRVL